MHLVIFYRIPEITKRSHTSWNVHFISTLPLAFENAVTMRLLLIDSRASQKNGNKRNSASLVEKREHFTYKFIKNVWSNSGVVTSGLNTYVKV